MTKNALSFLYNWNSDTFQKNATAVRGCVCAHENYNSQPDNSSLNNTSYYHLSQSRELFSADLILISLYFFAKVKMTLR